MDTTHNPINSDNISEFYDSFKTDQIKTGINLRHYMIFNHCFKTGLKKEHNVLEIGCGIGTFTKLLSRYISKGRIIATDISSQSIEIAKQSMRTKQRISFFVSDMMNFNSDNKFDFVVLADVLEHIPLEQYGRMFEIISKHMNDNSIMAINIPHPEMIRFLQKNEPEKLQIIDNPVEMNLLTKAAYHAGLKLRKYIPYSIFNKEHDYVFMQFLKTDSIMPFHSLSSNKIRINKLIYKIKFFTSSLINK